MTKIEAQDIARRLNSLKSEVFAKVVRILPRDQDVILDKDNGWDVEVTVI